MSTVATPESLALLELIAEHRDELDALYPVLADGASAPAQRFQQTSGMVMAKGVEDTAFYRFNRFVALNEVGGHPDHVGVAPSGFHRTVAQRAAQLGVDMPITRAVVALLDGQLTPADAVVTLMGRGPASELM